MWLNAYSTLIETRIHNQENFKPLFQWITSYRKETWLNTYFTPTTIKIQDQGNVFNYLNGSHLEGKEARFNAHSIPLMTNIQDQDSSKSSAEWITSFEKGSRAQCSFHTHNNQDQGTRQCIPSPK